MVNHKNTWRDSPEVFQRQLDLNQRQLALNPDSPDYPVHWRHLNELVTRATALFPITRILDIGCGCGVAYELFRRFLPKGIYTGVDYSIYAVGLAERTWRGDFRVINLWDLTPEDVSGYDLVHSDALLEVLPDGDDALNHLLSLKPKALLLNRVKNRPHLPKGYEVYEAYGMLSTYSYHHNREEFLENIRSNYKFYWECSIPPYSAFFMWETK